MLFRRSPQITPLQHHADRLVAVEDAVHTLNKRMVELEELHSALSGAHAKLRNKFYGELSGLASQNRKPGIDNIPHGDKAALRRALGVVPAGVRAPMENDNGE
jgi:hypothetical protein